MFKVGKNLNKKEESLGSVGWRVIPHTRRLGPDPRSGHVPGLFICPPSGACAAGNQSMYLSHTDVSPSLSLHLPLSLKSVNISSGEDYKI